MFVQISTIESGGWSNWDFSYLYAFPLSENESSKRGR